MRALLVELIGTAMLLYLDTSIAVSSRDVVSGGLLSGLVLFVLIAALGGLSGAHFNPAITLAFAMLGRFPWRWSVPYFAAQLAGSVLGTLLTLGLYGRRDLTPAHLGATLPANGVSDWRAVLVEGVVTAVLVLIAAAAVVRAPRAVVAPAVGLTLGVVIIAAAPLTGGAVNPARAFGPNLLDGHAGTLWIYLLAPMVGAASAALTFRYVLAPARPPSTGLSTVEES